MKISEYISSAIDRLPKGYVFTYSDFNIEVDKKEAAVKALNRMITKGKIAKLAKGKYYKPEATPFGNLQPNQAQVVKDLLEENGKATGYLTGYSIYPQLGLTTQVSSTIQIGKNDIRPKFKRDRYTISFIKQRNTITKENIPLLQVLDAINYIKKISDTAIEMSCKRFVEILKTIPDNELSKLVRLSLKYPPATRALLGVLLEQVQKSDLTQPLLKSLNPITKYKIIGKTKAIPYAEKWNIV